MSRPNEVWTGRLTSLMAARSLSGGVDHVQSSATRNGTVDLVQDRKPANKKNVSRAKLQQAWYNIKANKQ